MRRKSPPIPSSDHRPQRRRIDDKHEDDMHNQKSGEDPDRPEMPVARRLKAAEQRREPGELRGLVDRESREHRQHAQNDDKRDPGLFGGYCASPGGGVPAAAAGNTSASRSRRGYRAAGTAASAIRRSPQDTLR